MKPLIYILFFVSLAYGQATWTAASCNQADVNSVINGPRHVANNGDIVIIPAGSCTWTSTINTPSGVGLTIRGTGVPINTASVQGASLSCQQTVITDNAGVLINMSPVFSSAPSRISCMKWIPNNPYPNNLNPFFIGGETGTCSISGCAQIRIDNMTIPSSWVGVGGEGIFVVANVFGVGDHNNIGDTVGTGIQLDGFNVAHGHWQGAGNYGDNSWASADTLGTNQAFYVENNKFISGFGTDMDVAGTDYGGGRAVCRYNNFNPVTAAASCTNHGTDTAGRPRSGRQLEIYRNTMVGDSNTAALAAVRGGVLYIFDNTMTGTANSLLALSVQRPWRELTPYGQCTGEAGNSSWDQVDTTVSLGPFTFSSVSGTTINFTGGTLSINAAAAVTAGKPYAVWDTNKLLGTTNPANLHAGSQILSNTSTSITVIDVCDASLPNDVFCPAANDPLMIGKVNVCMDQTTRGKGLLVTGDTPVLSSTNMPGSVAQALDPSYITNNSTGSLAMGVGGGDPGIIQNRDFYVENANQGAQTSTTSPFDGTTTIGMGHGTFANRPTTCAPGSAAGIPGVGYWATDQQILYACFTTNQGGCTSVTGGFWCFQYAPYQYPHPLTTPPSTAIAGVRKHYRSAVLFVSSLSSGALAGTSATAGATAR